VTPGGEVVVELLDHRAGGFGDTLPAGMGRQGSAEVVRGSQLQGLVNHGSSSLQHLHHKQRPQEQQQQGTPTATPMSATAAAAAAAAAAAGDGSSGSLWDGGGGGSFSWRAWESNGVSGGSKSKGSSSRVCLGQAWVNVGASVRLFWNAVKQPHMLRPVVFLFLLLVSCCCCCCLGLLLAVLPAVWTSLDCCSVQLRRTALLPNIYHPIMCSSLLAQVALW
jgi:hypothetical protein